MSATLNEQLFFVVIYFKKILSYVAYRSVQNKYSLIGTNIKANRTILVYLKIYHIWSLCVFLVFYQMCIYMYNIKTLFLYSCSRSGIQQYWLKVPLKYAKTKPGVFATELYYCGSAFTLTNILREITIIVV